MEKSDIIVGVQKELTNNQKGTKWNNKRLKWTITHHNSSRTRQHDIELLMTLLSSERIVMVDGKQQLRVMCSFGFKGEFQISPSLKGLIVQDGFNFQLFLNGQSFSDCCRQNYSYQPPIINKPEQQKVYQAIKDPLAIKPSPQRVQSRNVQENKKPSEQKSKIEQPKITQVSIKDMQSQALKILIQQKRQRQLKKQ